MSIEEKTLQKSKIYIPKLYKVVLLNDNSTTMDFVVDVLKKIFNKSHDEAVNIMLNIHQKGRGICGVYTKEIAFSKQHEVHIMAQKAGFALKCEIEEE